MNHRLSSDDDYLLADAGGRPKTCDLVPIPREQQWRFFPTAHGREEGGEEGSFLGEGPAGPGTAGGLPEGCAS